MALYIPLLAVWRRNPQNPAQVLSDHGSQYASHEWQSLRKSSGLRGSMSRRGNCHGNAVGEICHRLNREPIK
ncbi:hypothetical protein B8P98_10555 [Klebsiella quasivariicola]|nr:hypothetical protein B8P98_10555 [Klebsiella quasivariicola]